jgi:hypothetical protein
MCAQIYIDGFEAMIDSFQRFFRGILPIDENGFFKCEITLKEANSQLEEASKRWTGGKLIAKIKK